MSVACALADADGRYERTVTAWVDGRPDGLLALTARLADHLADLEVTLDVEPSPAFLVARARAREHRVPPGAPADGPAPSLAGLAGLRLVAGFRRRVAELVGARPAAAQLVDATLEAARLSRQVTRIGRELPADPTARDFWRADLDAWPELAGMCVTYGPEASGLLEQGRARVPATPDMYAPRPGARVVFHRYKRTAVAGDGETLRLYQSMFDQVHGFELWYDVDVRTHRVLRARALTPRLPYLGICESGQGRTRALVGVTLDDRWSAALRELTGGPHGCFQQTDLTADLFRLLTFVSPPGGATAHG